MLPQPADWFGRLGGDEFIGVLSTASEVGAARYAGRLDQRWRATSPLATFSGGWAVHDGPLTPRQVLARADEALYLAKGDGRDRSRSWINAAGAW